MANVRLEGFNAPKDATCPYRDVKRQNEWTMGYIQRHGVDPEDPEDEGYEG